MPDLVSGNRSQSTSPASLSILLGDGSGSYQQAQYYTSTGNASSIAIPDIDGDGAPDLVSTVNVPFDVDFLSVLRGAGDGTFASAPSISVGQTEPVSVAAADLTGDGKPDLAVATSANGARIYRGQPGAFTGDFALLGTHPTDGNPRSVTIGDLDGDGILDLVVGHLDNSSGGGAENVSTLLGTGLGDFAPAVSFPAGNAPASLALADLDEDGVLDLAVGNHQSNDADLFDGDDLHLFDGVGDGTFTLALSLPTPRPMAIAIADVDGDGRLDVATTGSTFSLWLGRRGGTYIERRFARPTGAFALSDLDGDGALDISGIAGGAILVLRNQVLE